MRENSVTIVEVGPRDGLQSEPGLLPTEVKVELLNRLIDAGLRKIEVTSFVNPKRVPQMADAEQLLREAPRHPDLVYVGLVLNQRGFERALDSGIDEVGFVVVASDTFNRRNQGVGTQESIAAFGRIAAAAKDAGVSVNVTISAAFGCPFEGSVTADRVLVIAEQLMQSAPCELALADTIGVATPWQVRSLLEQLMPVIGETPLRCHFHNTRNTGLANAFAAIEAGAGVIDASIGGVGGCPLAPNATGNIATEDLVYMLRHSGIETGLSMSKLLSTASWLGEQMGRTLPGMVSRAGDFPTSQPPLAATAQ